MKCNCQSPGFCKTHNRNMCEVRFNECHNQPGYFEVFQQAKTSKPKTATKQTAREFDPTSRPSIEREIGTGSGTELILILASPMWSWIGIKVTTGCKCKTHARMMNEQGADWVSDNMDVVIGWLKEEHGHQRITIPFSSTAASMMVKTSIRRARKRDDERSGKRNPNID